MGTLELHSEPLHQLLSVDYHGRCEAVAREVAELQLVIHIVELEHNVHRVVIVAAVGDFVVALLLGLDVLLALMGLLGTLLRYLVEALLLLVEVEGRSLTGWHRGEKVVAEVCHLCGRLVIRDKGYLVMEGYQSLHIIVGKPHMGEVYLVHVGCDEVVVGLAVAHGHVGHLLLLRGVVELYDLYFQLVILLLAAVILVDDVERLHAAVAVNEVSAETVPDDASEVAVALDVVHLLADLLVGVPLGVVGVKRYLAAQDLLRQALPYLLGLLRLRLFGLRLLRGLLFRLAFLLALAHIP